MNKEGLEYADKKDLFVAGFDTRVVITCPKCGISQSGTVWIPMEELEFQKRIFNFICYNKECNFKSTFLFYLGMELS